MLFACTAPRSIHPSRRDEPVSNFMPDPLYLFILFSGSVWILLGLVYLAWPPRRSGPTRGVLSTLKEFRLNDIFRIFRKGTGYQPRSARTTIQHLDSEAILIQLDGLMREDKLYRRDDLTLPELARVLGISRYQLSEILNRSRGQSFHKYLNSYRIDEARQLLEADRDSSALSIGYRVGFNSKSTYYSAFKQEVGMSPSDYRKQANP